MRSGIGRATAERITVCGLDVADDLMGKVSFPDLAFLLVVRRLPDERESRLFNAVLVSLADHGLTPSVLAARLTYTGAPELLAISKTEATVRPIGLMFKLYRQHFGTIPLHIAGNNPQAQRAAQPRVSYTEQGHKLATYYGRHPYMLVDIWMLGSMIQATKQDTTKGWILQL